MHPGGRVLPATTPAAARAGDLDCLLDLPDEIEMLFDAFPVDSAQLAFQASEILEHRVEDALALNRQTVHFRHHARRTTRPDPPVRHTRRE